MPSASSWRTPTDPEGWCGTNRQAASSATAPSTGTATNVQRQLS
ncbi:hypothetical protein BJ969_003136 [Saccharopolyspora gloriosae]|uniref:Uncharacterized protein n=1 Tax=Saccharopolyspora gloriosae TaxID=455344 RepID=A0A840NID1_9PSEU|nr:hypothetical protein [Saccharopolyspora gloriosae]MBB5070048.1 hypothetical protein [Saccharopolyspora gloriosae]